MPQTTPAILDYASVTPHSSLRAAGKSSLRIYDSVEGVKIVEKLAGGKQALTGIAFGIGVAVIIGTWVWQLWDHWWGEATIGAIVILLIITLILTIIDNTWRRTTLEASKDGISLTFNSLYTLSKFKWSLQHISAIDLYLGTDEAKAIQMYELRIETITHAPARLFTGHDLNELQSIVAALRKHLSLPIPEAS